jgi:hypothetical protein
VFPPTDDDPYYYILPKFWILLEQMHERVSGQLFNSTVTNKPTIIKPVKNMLDFKANGLVFKGIVENYIVETSKRL